MMRTLLIPLSFVSAIFLPWPVTALLALLAASTEPLVPLAIGLFADVLYYTPLASAWPLFTLLGAVATVAALFVRSRLRTSPVR
jgi:hypothetical protein